MKLENSIRIFWVVAGAIFGVLFIILGIFVYLMLYQPNIVPLNETFGSFWLKNISILIASFAFSSSAVAAAYNALEQRHLRYMENYPYLEIFPMLSVDPLPLPIPKYDTPPELASFNRDYLSAVAPSQSQQDSEIKLRYMALVFHNVGHGYITRIKIAGKVEVPGRGFPTREFTVDRRFNLAPDNTYIFTLFPILGLPGFRVIISSVTYYGYFVCLTDFEGKNEFEASYPFSIPPERSDYLFFDDFQDSPVGQGWTLDFWGQWKPTEYIFVPQPSANDHYIILSGNDGLYTEIPHVNNQGGAYKDLVSIFEYGQTVKITMRVRSTPNTTAKIQLWCHDVTSSPKNRSTIPITPEQSWEEISMLYTSTNSPHLRVHLLYTPGEGQIQVDRVTVEGLYT